MGIFSRHLARNMKWEFAAKGRIFAYPSVADVNGDGLLEVVFASDDHFIYALRGSDGVVAWSFETDAPVRSSPLVGDINGDGVMEVVAGSDDSNIYALNGVDGRVLWAFRAEGPIRSTPALADIDGDGRCEVIVGGSDSAIYAIDGVTGELVFQSSHRGPRSGAPVQSSPCLVDLDGDGRMEIIAGSSSNHILIFDPEGSLRIRKEFEAPNFNASLAAGDINGDRVVEIVACSDNGAIYVINSEGQTLWSRVAGIGIRSSPVLADVNGDGKMEILVSATQALGGGGRLVCMGAQGDVLWDKPIRGMVDSMPVPVDIDHDGGVETVAFTQGDEISVLGSDGQAEKTIPAKGEPRSGPAIADVDADGELEIIYASSDGRMICLGSHCGSRQCQILNSGARSDLRNSGVFRTVIQAIEDLRRSAAEVNEIGGDGGKALQKLTLAEKEQGLRDISPDLEEIRQMLLHARTKVTSEKRRGERLARIKNKLRFFSSLDVDGSSQLSLAVAKIERQLAQGIDVGRELDAAEGMVEELDGKSKEKLQALNTKRLSFLLGQFLEKFPDPTDSDIEEFIQYLRSENLPFLPYEIKRALETRKHERKFQSLRDSGRFDFMSEEEKVIAIGSGLAESIVHDIHRSMSVPMDKIQQRMDEVSSDYTNVPKLVLSDEGKILTDELRKTLRDIPPQKVISAAVSLFCLYITKLFDFYQELTDFETAYSRFKTNMDYLTTSFGAGEIVSQFQEKACHGIFAEEVRVKRILEM